MKASFLLAAFVSLLVGGIATSDGGKDSSQEQPRTIAAKEAGEVDQRPSQGQLKFRVRVCEGDPLGSPEDGTLRVVVAPRIASSENRTWGFVSGGHSLHPDDAKVVISSGINIEGKWTKLKDDHFRIDVTASLLTKGAQTGDTVQLHTESVRTIRKVKLDETVRFRLAKGTGDKQMWVEITAQEFLSKSDDARP